MTTHDQSAWAIVGKYGLYYGTWSKRRDAMREHAAAIEGPWPSKAWHGDPLSPAELHAWHRCYNRGDRAVKVRVTIVKSPTV